MNAIVEKANLSRLAALRRKSIVENADDTPLISAATFPAQTLPSDLRIPIAALAGDLDYVVPKPALEDDLDSFLPQIRVKGTTAWIDIVDSGDDAPYILPGPVSGRDWTIPYKIRRNLFGEELTPEKPTEWEFRYIYWAGGINDTESDISTFAIDLTRPYQIKNPPTDRTPGAATWPADLPPATPIDEAYLEGKTGIVVNPAIPANYEETDVYRFYFGPAPDPVRDTPVFEGVLSATRDAEIPTKAFVDAPDGPNQLIYTAQDLAGNLGRRSNFSQRTVQHAKDPDPATVLPPTVTLANGTDGDNLIDLADTRFDTKGVEFKVKVPNPNAQADTIAGYWGGQAAGAEQRVGANTELTFYAPYDLVKQVYGNTDGIVKTVVSFKMFRGTRLLAEEDVEIDVDISYIGPDPITIGLDPPTLTTTAGSDDEIKEGDYGDAGINAHIVLFTTPPTEEGWLIDVFYDDIKIGESIPLTSGQEGDPLDHPLPWSIVGAQGSGTKVLRYTLYTPGAVNPTASKTKDIVVEPFPIEMAAPVILGLAGSRRRIGCSTLNFPTATVPNDGTERRNMLVRVLPNTYTVDGETITLKYQAYELADPTTPIPGTDAEATFPISGTFPTDGAIIGIGTYAEDFKPAHLQKARVTYSISRGGGWQ
ncbi:hypothetical protein [Pseudomonas sp. SWRI99]|uniref:hypothetical protein n=1 Tax=Pseudomonas sp. SWRI99 TaxID=2745506 RepID=UPI0016451750|nr:hypothetical protein [Pseudomonas sp. SWRI99]MBC3775443.1 hypothetical protein [Pseudomonas sp. SWRI99]